MKNTIKATLISKLKEITDNEIWEILEAFDDQEVDSTVVEVIFKGMLPSMSTEQILQFLGSDPSLVRYFDFTIDDIEIIKEIVVEVPNIYCYIKDESVRSSLSLIDMVIGSRFYNHPNILKAIPTNVILTDDFVLKHISRNYNIFDKLSQDSKSDRKLLLELVKKNCNIFNKLKPEFKNDRAFVKEVISNGKHLLSFKSVKEVIMDTDANDFSKDVDLLRCVHPDNMLIVSAFDNSLLENVDIVLELVAKNSYVLKFLPSTIKSNKTLYI